MIFCGACGHAPQAQPPNPFVLFVLLRLGQNRLKSAFEQCALEGVMMSFAQRTAPPSGGLARVCVMLFEMVLHCTTCPLDSLGQGHPLP